MSKRLRITILTALLLVAMASMTLVASANHKADQLRPDLPTITDLVVGSDDFDTLETAVVAAGLADTLAGPGPYTVFAPTDAAFAALDSSTLNAALADPNGLLTDVLLYHVISGDIGSDTALTLNSAMTLQGQRIHIKYFEGDVYLNDEIKITATDIIASNGRVHVIDAVLLPPTPASGDDSSSADMPGAGEGFTRPELPTITDIVVSNDNFETLETAVVAAGLAGTLDAPGPYTVFAPTDAAFAALDSATLNAALADPNGLLTDVLLYHVVSGDVGSEIVLTLDEATTLQGETVRIKFFDGYVYLNDEIKVTTTDVVAANGTIHIIDAVLLPPSIAPTTGTGGGGADMTTAEFTRPGLPTITDIAVGDDRFETLVTALSAAGLAGVLDQPGPYTVFAPTDDAFAKLPASTLNAVLADPNGLLTDILLYHVVSGDVGSEIVLTLDEATTLQGETVRIKFFDGNVYLNDEVKVIITDIVAANGVIHVIDTVLLPPTE